MGFCHHIVIGRIRRRDEGFSMKKIAGIGILCMAFGMLLMLLIRDRIVGFLVMAVLAAAGYFYFCE